MKISSEAKVCASSRWLRGPTRPWLVDPLARRLRESLGSERGATLVLVALTFSLIVGFAALATDVGILMAERAKLQAVADASALAGTTHLPCAICDIAFG